MATAKSIGLHPKTLKFLAKMLLIKGRTVSRGYSLQGLQREVIFEDCSPMDSLYARSHRNGLEVEFAFHFVSWLEADPSVLLSS